MSSIQSAVSLDALQFAVAQVVLLSYNSLPLVKVTEVPSPALFVLELSELLYPTFPFFSSSS